MDDSTAKLWQNYWQNRDSDSLNGLMSAHYEVVKDLAEEIIAGDSGKPPFDNLFAEGLFTLKDCILAYSHDCPIPFEDYCGEKIKQAMLEELEYWQANQKPD